MTAASHLESALAEATSAAEDVASLFSAVQEFAGGALDDDTTVASIELK